MAGMALFIYPICCTKSLTTLRYFSLAIMAIVFYTVGVALVQTPEYYIHNSKQEGYKMEWIADDFDLKWFQGWATMMLSYNCQITLFYVRGELMHKTVRRTRKISRTLLVILASLYCLISISGYMSLGKGAIPKVFTLRKRLDVPGNEDIWMLVAQFLFLFAALFHIPITMYPSREQIYIFYKIEKSTFNNMIITAVMTVLAFLIPCLYPDVTNILGLLGGITVGSSGYLLPVILKIVSLRERSWFSPNKLFHVILALCIFALQCLSVYVSVTSS